VKAVVDTNVAVAANGRDTHAGLPCQVACIEFLQKVVSAGSRHQMFLDDLGLILGEYRGRLNHRGAPGTGDIFYKFLHDHLYSARKVVRVSITPVNDETRGFDELPPNSFDKNDRKFLAVALVSSATVCNAVDTDWHEHSAFIAALGVTVNQICPEHGCAVQMV